MYRRNQAMTFHLGKGAFQVMLRSLHESFQFIDYKSSALGFRREELGAAAQLRAVVLRFHQHDDLDLLVIAAEVHFLAQKRVEAALGKTHHAGQQQNGNQGNSFHGLQFYDFVHYDTVLRVDFQYINAFQQVFDTTFVSVHLDGFQQLAID